MILRRLLRHRGLGINLLAGFCFLMLAVYGWGLSWSELGSYLLILILLLGGLIGTAALLGWLLHKFKSRNAKSPEFKSPEFKSPDFKSPSEDDEPK